jgi:hypothetical protein
MANNKRCKEILTSTNIYQLKMAKIMRCYNLLTILTKEF